MGTCGRASGFRKGTWEEVSQKSGITSVSLAKQKLLNVPFPAFFHLAEHGDEVNVIAVAQALLFRGVSSPED